MGIAGYEKTFGKLLRKGKLWLQGHPMPQRGAVEAKAVTHPYNAAWSFIIIVICVIVAHSPCLEALTVKTDKEQDDKLGTE